MLLLSTWIATFLEWFKELDDVVDAGFFATLAGLSLAAAAFLSGAISNSRVRLTQMDDKLSNARKDANEYPENREKAEQWAKEHPSATEEEIEGKDYQAEVKVFVQRHLGRNAAQSSLDELVASKNSIIKSFYCFLIGLGEAMTLDLWAKASINVAAEGAATCFDAIRCARRGAFRRV